MGVSIVRKKAPQAAPQITLDRAGSSVAVGDRVRVIEISPSLMKLLPAEDIVVLNTMVGKVYSVDEIDQWNQAWVQGPKGHSLGLDPHEMEKVQRKRSARTAAREAQ